MYFSRNQARIGGGLCLELKSVVYIFPYLNNIVNFDNNSADYGGAVYILPADESSWQYYVYSNLECFFQSETLQNPSQNYNINNGTTKCNKKLFIFSLIIQDTRILSTNAQLMEHCLMNSNFSVF